MQPKIKVLLLDVDGIIIKENRFSERYARDFGVPVEKILKYIHGEHQKVLVGKADFKSEISKYLKDWRWTKSLDYLVDYWYSAEKEIDLEVVSEIGKLQAKGLKIYLATNQTKDRMEYLEKNLPELKKFEKIYVSCRLGVKKPHPDFFKKILDDLSPIKPNEILFFDNNADKLVGAKEVGIKTELYTDLGNFKRALQTRL